MFFAGIYRLNWSPSNRHLKRLTPVRRLLAKQTSAMEAQLNELQENLREETRQKLAALARLRQSEEEAVASRELLEEEEENRKQLEAKITAFSVQVNCKHEHISCARRSYVIRVDNRCYQMSCKQTEKLLG
jgi:endonuclease/exonuclease/phosphatase (EEP) superfamily protein YafD